MQTQAMEHLGPSGRSKEGSSPTGRPKGPTVKCIPVTNEAVQGPACACWVPMSPGIKLRAPRPPTGSRWGSGGGVGWIERRRTWFNTQTEEAMMLKHTIPGLMFSGRALGQHEAGGGRPAPQPSHTYTQLLKSDQQKSFRGKDVQTPDPMARLREGRGIGQSGLSRQAVGRKPPGGAQGPS